MPGARTTRPQSSLVGRRPDMLKEGASWFDGRVKCPSVPGEGIVLVDDGNLVDRARLEPEPISGGGGMVEAREGGVRRGASGWEWKDGTQALESDIAGSVA